jgi:four helix bundle protein
VTIATATWPAVPCYTKEKGQRIKDKRCGESKRIKNMKFEDLEVWKRSARLSADIYKALRDLTDYGFRDQITRCSLSIPSNVAEGFERLSQKECLTFLSYAKGSCAELRTQIWIGIEIAYINPDIGKSWVKETKEISSMLSGLIKTKKGFLKKK